MRTRALVLAAVLPMAMASLPSAARAQRVIFDDCHPRSYDCFYDSRAAREARQIAAEARAEAREAASHMRAEARRYASEARAEARMAERVVPMARFRADELRSRMRDRVDRIREWDRVDRERLRDRIDRERARDRIDTERLRDRMRLRDRL